MEVRRGPLPSSAGRRGLATTTAIRQMRSGDDHCDQELAEEVRHCDQELADEVRRGRKEDEGGGGEGGRSRRKKEGGAAHLTQNLTTLTWQVGTKLCLGVLFVSVQVILRKFAHVNAQQRKRVQTTSPKTVSYTRPKVAHSPRVAVRPS